MRIVNTDNYGRDYPDEKFVSHLPSLSKETAQQIADLINEYEGERKMNNEILKALKGSIEKWESIIKGEDGDLAGNNCPLCKYFSLRCTNFSIKCPVYDKTRRDNCNETPYWKWRNHMDTEHPEQLSKKFVECPTCEQLAREELAFLKSLLPVKVEIETRDVVKIDDHSYAFKLEGEKLSEYFTSYNDTYKVVATNLILPTGRSSNPNNVNDTILQESTGKCYVFIQKRFLILKDKYCSECGRKKNG